VIAASGTVSAQKDAFNLTAALFERQVLAKVTELEPRPVAIGELSQLLSCSARARGGRRFAPKAEGAGPPIASDL